MFPLLLIFKEPFLLLLLTLLVAFLNTNNFRSYKKEVLVHYKPPNKTASSFCSACTLKATNHFKLTNSGF